ncbi:MAG: hypothetical protein COB67_07330 [SAR324 cluster bacterium]|uniref:Tetratricopeptide repeat protein n=1 Tax=SAR324 cluster bacterium TaxID=2024889 RepID=A0A2A4T310_9DELT|nr:MAG: hypothetical protein COB67_07330 [SAR324 cluster bacterium]
MKKLTLFFILAVTLVYSLSTALAATEVYQPILEIPSSAKQRKLLATQLESNFQQSQDALTIAQLGILYSVIAGYDDFSLKTVQKADRLLGLAVKKNLKNYELIAAHGSIIAMQASFVEGSTSATYRFLKKGFRKMDRAIKKAPNHIGALMQRGNNSLRLPKFLRRLHYAVKDFTKVLELLEGTQSLQFKSQVQYRLGEAYEKQKNKEMARKYWTMAANNKIPIWSARAQEKLN